MDAGSMVLLLLVGVAAGFLNVVAGGGSLLTMPVMIFLGLPGPMTNGTNRVAILAQNITAVRAFWRQGFSSFRLSLTLSLCALPGAVAGAYLGTRLEGIWFNRVLAVVMLGVMLLMMLKKKKSSVSPQEGQPVSSQRVWAAHLLMVLIGLYGGFIQAGVGFLLMAVLHRILGEDLVRVNMHKVFIIGSYTLVALAIFAGNGHVQWSAGLGLAAGNSIGGWIGSYFTVKKGEGAIKIIFNVTLLALAIKLLLS